MSAPRLPAHPSPSLLADEPDGTVRAKGDLNRAVEVFLAERNRLIRVAHQVLGDRAAAEDVVQDAWLRWQRVDRDEVKNPGAFLTTTTTHLAINMLQSARHRRETPTELLHITETGRAPESADHAERAAAAEQLLGFLMAKLTSSELAAYLLRKSFDYPYQEIATLLGTSVPGARQLIRRAQVALASSRERPVDCSAHRRLVRAFTAATRGDIASLEAVLAAAAHRCHARGAPNAA